MHPTAPTDEPADDPEIRRAKLVLFLLVAGILIAVIVTMLVLWQPRDQVVVRRWPNGYPRTETHCVMGPLREPIAHGRHRAWHENGLLAEEGRYERGKRTGTWRYWSEDGTLDLERSGHYRDDARERPLAADER